MSLQELDQGHGKVPDISFVERVRLWGKNPAIRANRLKTHQRPETYNLRCRRSIHHPYFDVSMTIEAGLVFLKNKKEGIETSLPITTFESITEAGQCTTHVGLRIGNTEIFFKRNSITAAMNAFGYI